MRQPEDALIGAIAQVEHQGDEQQLEMPRRRRLGLAFSRRGRRGRLEGRTTRRARAVPQRRRVPELGAFVAPGHRWFYPSAGATDARGAIPLLGPPAPPRRPPRPAPPGSWGRPPRRGWAPAARRGRPRGHWPRGTVRDRRRWR